MINLMMMVINLNKRKATVSFISEGNEEAVYDAYCIECLFGNAASLEVRTILKFRLI